VSTNDGLNSSPKRSVKGVLKGDTYHASAFWVCTLLRIFFMPGGTGHDHFQALPAGNLNKELPLCYSVEISKNVLSGM